MFILLAYLLLLFADFILLLVDIVLLLADIFFLLADILLVLPDVQSIYKYKVFLFHSFSSFLPSSLSFSLLLADSQSRHPSLPLLLLRSLLPFPPQISPATDPRYAVHQTQATAPTNHRIQATAPTTSELHSESHHHRRTPPANRTSTATCTSESHLPCDLESEDARCRQRIYSSSPPSSSSSLTIGGTWKNVSCRTNYWVKGIHTQ